MILFYNPQCAKPGYHRIPAAILQVASMIEGLYPYEIVDGNLDQETDKAEEIILRIKNKGIRRLAVSIMPGPQLASAVRDIRKIKKAVPDLIVIAGGYFPLIHTDVCARDRDIDYVVVGPGESAFKALVQALEAGDDVRGIPGLAFLRDGQVVRSPAGPGLDPDALPEYPYHRLDMERYVVPTFLGSRTLSHHSSFGCPFACNFCGVVRLAHGKWMGQSGERLGDLAESMVRRWRINALEFHDNNFFASEKRVAAFCDRLIEKGLKIRWWGEGRADTLLNYKDETWIKMKKSGLTMAFIGAESGDDNDLKRMNKGGGMSGRTIRLLAAKMKSHGIIPEFSFILGNPPHARENIKKTIRFIRRLKRLAPEAEIIMYRYDPVPMDGALFDEVMEAGFRFPETLDEWARPDWIRIQQRKSAALPWLTKEDQNYISDFQTVLNAYYPTVTARHIPKGSLSYRLLRIVGGVRYHLKWYRAPIELRWLQARISYQRPETSGF